MVALSAGVATPLTDQQELFAQFYVDLNGNGTKAYLQAYPDCSEDSAQVCASKLIRVPHVEARIREIARSVKDEIELRYPRESITADRFIAHLASMGLDRTGSTRSRDRIQAIMGAAKLAGMVVDRVEVLDEATLRRWAERDGLDADSIVASSKAMLVDAEHDD